MRIIFNYNKFKTTLLFIHGFGKDISSWNTTQSGKSIKFEETLSKTANTILIEFKNEDYEKSMSDKINEIYSLITDFLKTQMIIIAHSYGCFYALLLAEKYPKVFNKLLLLDPTVKNNDYLLQLEKAAKGTAEDSIECAKLDRFPSLPSGEGLPSQIIVRVHLNITDDIKKIVSLNSLTNKNVKSRLTVHYDIGHMIHWSIPNTIIDSVKELIKS